MYVCMYVCIYLSIYLSIFSDFKSNYQILNVVKYVKKKLNVFNQGIKLTY